METKDFPTAVIASLSSGVLLCDFAEMQTAAEYLMGHPIWTHELASKEFQLEIKRTILEQCPGMPTSLEGVTRDNYLTKLAEIEAEIGKVVRIRQGGH